jgi:Protein of unknown function (DUF3142)
MQIFPQLMLWAWETPQDLRFLKEDVGVAFLATEIKLQGQEVRATGRRNPLRVNPSTPLMAVVRIETDRIARPILDDAQRIALMPHLLEAARLPRVQGLQLDFDALQSERPFYEALLIELRKQLPEMPISITALASWCLDDPWIRKLPVDERVPMFFRMGPEDATVRRLLARGRDVIPEARFAYGLTTDEKAPTLKRGRRMYVFHPGPWSETDFNHLKEMPR